VHLICSYALLVTALQMNYSVKKLSPLQRIQADLENVEEKPEKASGKS